MLRLMCKSKIHGCIVTQKNINYKGSIAIDRKLLQLSDIKPYEIVLVINVNTGIRFETYAIAAKYDSGIISLQGGAARLGEIGDKLIIISYGFYSEAELNNYKPKIIIVDKENRKIKIGK